MFTVFLSGCSGTAKVKNSEVPKETSSPAKTSKLSESPITYKWLISENPNYPCKNDSPIFKYYEEKTNVKIDFVSIPNANYTEKYNILLSSNDVTDISYPKKANVYGPKGTFLKLNDLIEKYAENGKKYILSNKAKPFLLSSDGGIYVFQTIYEDKGDRLTYAWSYRQDILNKLGLKEPTTPDEWYNVLKKVKEAYPNMIPLSYEKSAWRWDNIAGSFNVTVGMILNPTTDKFEFSPGTDNSKAAIEWFGKLYKEKLLDAEYFVNAKKDFDQKITSGKLFAWCEWATDSSNYTKNIRAGGQNDAVVNVAVPFKTSYGANLLSTATYVASDNVAALSPKIKNPETAIKFLDYIGFSKEGVAALNFGVPGVHWNMESYGPDYTDTELDKVIKGESGPWQLGYNNRMPRISLKAIFPEAGKKKDVKDDEYQKLLKAYKQKLEPYLRDTDPPAVGAFMSNEQNDRSTEILTNCTTISEEYRSKFITGNEPLSNWTKFTDQLKKNNVAELEKIYNDAYVKYKAAIK